MRRAKEVMVMTVDGFFANASRFTGYYALYLVMLLGRAVTVSIILTLFILLLRKTIFKNAIFLKGMLWGLLLFAPLAGKLTWIYEKRFWFRLLYWWQDICAKYKWFNWFYLAGMAAMGLYLFIQRRSLKRHIAGFRTARVCDTQIYVSDTVVSPFTAGCLRSKIVMPEKMLKQLNEEELRTILLHEKVHIHLGHLWCYLLWDILRVLLWMNPLFTLCLKYFQADLEDICDRVTVQKSSQSAYGYGNLLLKSMQMLSGSGREIKPTAAFAGEKEYREFKQRIKRIASYKPYNRGKLICLVVAAILCFVCAFIGIRSVSYPRYTPFDEMTIYSRTGEETLINDSGRLQQVVRKDSCNIYVDTKGLQSMLQDIGREDETVFLFWGGFYKMPGIGGGGNGVFVDLEEQTGEQVIPYQDADKDIFIWLLKWL